MRKSDWAESFGNYIESKRNEPFQWGVNDCCFFAGNWVDICTGSEITTKWKNRYSTGVQAARLLRRLGGLGGLADAHLERHLNPNFADVGDIGLLLNNGQSLLVICNGSVVFAPGKSGILALSSDLLTVTWKV